MMNAAAANFVEEPRADKRFAATADIFEESFRLLHEGVDYAVGNDARILSNLRAAPVG